MDKMVMSNGRVILGLFLLLSLALVLGLYFYRRVS